MLLDLCSQRTQAAASCCMIISLRFVPILSMKNKDLELLVCLSISRNNMALENEQVEMRTEGIFAVSQESSPFFIAQPVPVQPLFSSWLWWIILKWG